MLEKAQGLGILLRAQGLGLACFGRTVKGLGLFMVEVQDSVKLEGLPFGSRVKVCNGFGLIESYPKSSPNVWL